MSAPIVRVAVAVFVLAACKDPNGTVPRAHSTAPVAQPEAQSATTPTPHAIAVEVLSFGPPRSSIGFTGAKVTGSHNGTFGAFNGTLHFDPSNPAASRVEVSIEMASVQADDPRLTNHLKSPDFFDVANHPRATFTSTEVRTGGTNGATHTITGNLSLHGVTRAITFPATLAVTPSEVSARAEFSINRREFGITYPGMPDNLIRDEVAIRLELHAPRGGAAPAAPAPSGTPAAAGAPAP
jgi:polyisoprenoid-binding protein YceI